MAIKDYSTEPDMNTTISGINIAEGCAPSGINNAIRQLMADVKAEKDARDAAQDERDAAQDERDAAQDEAISAAQSTADAAQSSADAAQSSADAANAGLAGVVRSVNGVNADANGNVLFIHSSGANWVRWSYGLQVYFDTAETGSNGVASYTFEVPFSGDSFSMAANILGDTVGTYGVNIRTQSTTGFTAIVSYKDIQQANVGFRFIAIGAWK